MKRQRSSPEGEIPGPPKRLKGSPSPYRLICSDNRARRGVLTLPHAEVETPAFMPVGTYGSIKMIPSEVMEVLGPRMILGNTYHLGNRPGSQVVSSCGGLHGMEGWKFNLLTDSGGFQMVSLLSLASITEEGVEFQHPVTGDRALLTPEESIRVQNAIGADVMMALDDVVSAVEPNKERVEEALHRTTRWLDRCLQAHANPGQQHLWAIVQGGLHEDLRKESLKQLILRDTPGYAIGGLSGGEAKADFWKMVELCTRQNGEGLPVQKSRYLMGVGYPVDIVVCAGLGCDLFDCVYPTRTARFGSALTSEGIVRLKLNKYSTDMGPLDPNCDCDTCQNFTRAYLHRLVGKQPAALAAVTLHNLRYMHNLGSNLREAIQNGKYTEFLEGLLDAYFPENNPPKWIYDALTFVGYDLKNREWAGEEAFCGKTPHHIPHKSGMRL